METGWFLPVFSALKKFILPKKCETIDLREEKYQEAEDIYLNYIKFGANPDPQLEESDKVTAFNELANIIRDHYLEETEKNPGAVNNAIKLFEQIFAASGSPETDMAVDQAFYNMLAGLERYGGWHSYPKAIEIVQRIQTYVKHKNPRYFAEARLKMPELHHLSGDHRAAIKSYEEIINSYQKKFYQYANSAEEKDVNDAIESLKELIEVYRSLSSGDHKTTIKYYKEIINSYQKKLYQSANLAEEKDVNDAIESLKELIKVYRGLVELDDIT